MKTHVIHVKDMSRYGDAVYIGRAMPRFRLPRSPWANPYRVHPDHCSREEALRLYEDDVRERLVTKREATVAGLRDLAGHPLACFCRRDGEPVTAKNRCHGDIIIRILEEMELEGEVS